MPKDTPPQIQVALLPVDDLTPNPNNARAHPQEQVDQIAKSIVEFGFTNPILIDRSDDNIIIAGHGRRLALLDLMDGGFEVSLPGGGTLPPGQVPVIDCAGWTPSQRRAYTLADNAIAEQADWDKDMLALEVGFLDDEGEIGLDILGLDPGDLQEALAAKPDRGGFLDDLTTGPEKEDGGATQKAAGSATGVNLTFHVSAAERDVIIQWLNRLKKEFGLKTAAAALAAYAEKEEGA